MLVQQEAGSKQHARMLVQQEAGRQAGRYEVAARATAPVAARRSRVVSANPANVLARARSADAPLSESVSRRTAHPSPSARPTNAPRAGPCTGARIGQCEGAPADVFASADQEQMDRVVAAGCAAAAPRTFASNELTIVTPKDNPAEVRALEDLSRDGVTALLCGPAVPAGRYARSALMRADVAVTSASDEPSVTAIVSKVELGVADAGVVYRTDARAAAGRVREVPIPARCNVTATYPIVPTSTGEQPQHGEAFVAFVLGTEGRRVLDEHGFGAP